jgi:hypothetical protein
MHNGISRDGSGGSDIKLLKIKAETKQKNLIERM